MRNSFINAVRNFWDVHVSSGNPPNIIPTPSELVRNFRDHSAFVQAEQIRFQDHLGKIGLNALEHMSYEDVCETFPATRRRDTMEIIRFKWDAYDPNNM